jgi:hypothetical protein
VRSARSRAAVGAGVAAPAGRGRRDHPRVGAVRRSRPARPLPRLHRRPAPAVRGGHAQAAGARRGWPTSTDRHHRHARWRGSRCTWRRSCTTSASHTARATPRRAR